MRVIAGNLGGRTFQSPNGHRTHPMSDKARGALFNMLGNIAGMSVLDAFAGSGALTYEALSRGAATAIAVEVDKSAHSTITQNLRSLGLEKSAKAIRANVSGWSDNNPTAQFDLILCDPPYDHTRLPLIQKLVKHIKKDGLLVLSWPGNQEAPELAETTPLTTKDYGDAQLAVYRRT